LRNGGFYELLLGKSRQGGTDGGVAFVARMHTVLVEKPERKTRFGSTMCKCENNMKIDHQIWCKGAKLNSWLRTGTTDRLL
jgi:hypothetical protein